MIFWLTLSFIMSQVFAWTAIISDICSFQFKERKKILIFFIISSFCIALQYIFLERYVPAIIWFLAVFRFFVSYHTSNKKWMLLFVPASFFITFLFYKDYLDLLILCASLLSTVSVFQQEDQHLRIIMMWATSCFIIYNLIIFTPLWLVLECIFLSSNIVWYYRHYIKKRLV